MSDEGTRGQALAAAKRLFAQRGFYGTSLAQIGEELGLSKQALLHHFRSKEKLYGEILEAISCEIMTLVESARDRHEEPVRQLEAVILDLHEAMMERPEVAHILMREILDVEARAESARTWYLRPMLDQLTAMAKAIPGKRRVSAKQALTAIYALLGVSSYFSVSGVVLTRIYDAPTLATMKRHFPQELRAHVAAVVARLHGDEPGHG